MFKRTKQLERIADSQERIAVALERIERLLQRLCGTITLR